ncbi:amidase domain-containing protein [Desmospora activa]|uniref:Putative amidase-like protein n=1 Tax=Desmospora activa DSM 45169 TaxID=1121389 RepID=A0A2T4Z7W3_9BACL|nr:amidase domain-containing protein [Desmospora activa]PTM57980.1 putative amidase-like protein [Desmospora activa DSM 45169]
MKAFLQGKMVAILAMALILVLAGCGGDKEATGDKGKSETPEESGTTDSTASISDEELVDSISLYNESAKSKEEIQQEHTSAVTIVVKRSEQQKTPTKTDLDNQQYRDFVIGAATDLEGLSEAERKAVGDYAKDVADYDNKEKNKQIEELRDKATKEGLTPGEKAELINLLPAKDSVPLKQDKVDPEHNGDTGVDKNKAPGSNSPDQDKATEEESGESSHPPAAENGTDNPDQQSPSDEGSANDGQEEPASEGENNEQEQQEPPANGEEEAEEQQPPAPEEENKDEEGNGENGTDQDGSEEQPPVEEEKPADDGMKEANGYDRAKARDYAYQWWNSRNNEQYGFYSRERDCVDCWYDCTNFTSQAMVAGGLVQWKSDPWWYYSDTKPSYAWGLANSQYKHLQQRAEPANSLSELKVGDIVHADINGDGHINHSAIITKIELGQIYVTQHTTDRKDAPLSTWFWNGYNVFGWKMGTADNTSR